MNNVFYIEDKQVNEIADIFVRSFKGITRDKAKGSARLLIRKALLNEIERIEWELENLSRRVTK